MIRSTSHLHNLKHHNRPNKYPPRPYVHTLYFNKDIALIGRQKSQQSTPSYANAYKWWTFIDNLEATYILKNTNSSRHGGHNYTQNNLIDGFYFIFIKKNPNNNHKHQHWPQLKAPPYKAFHSNRHTNAKPPPPPRPTSTPQILNLKPIENRKTFWIQFFENNSTRIN